MIASFFNELGDSIHERWRQESFADEAFPRITQTIANEFFAVPGSLYIDILRWLGSTGHLPRQRRKDNNFGKPNVTVYATDSFTIEVLFWRVGSTAIHQHAFEGCFSVIAGSSIHCVYTFEPNREFSTSFATGAMTLLHSEYLRAGSTRVIGMGASLIHSLFHCVDPTVSVVIRRNATLKETIEFVYSYPSVRLNPGALSHLHKKKLDGFDIIVRQSLDQGYQYALECCSKQDPILAFNLLARLFYHVNSPHSLELYILLASKFFSKAMSEVSAALEEQKRIQILSRIRETLRHEEERLFMAALMSIPCRIPIQQFVVDNLDGGCDELKKIAILISKILRTSFSNGPDISAVHDYLLSDKRVMIGQGINGPREVTDGLRWNGTPNKRQEALAAALLIPLSR